MCLNYSLDCALYKDVSLFSSFFFSHQNNTKQQASEICRKLREGATIIVSCSKNEVHILTEKLTLI
jgi:hypothetical protein